MISDLEREQYFVSAGDIIPGGSTTWFILDWDQRRTYAVIVDKYCFDEELAVEYLNNHIHELAPDVCAVVFTPDGELLRTSNDPTDDRTQCVEYIPLSAHDLPPHIHTISRSELVELRRLGANVDLVSYNMPHELVPKQVAFKYYFLSQFQNRLWDELQLWIRLPTHTNIVGFDRVVVDELEGHVVGFTASYIPGGTLEENTSRLFKLNHLRQLTGLVDELNLTYSVAHQDMAPRNLLLDEGSDNVMLFDFNFSARIGGEHYWEERNDIKGLVFTIYELITRDLSFRSQPFEDQNMADVTAMAEWPQHSSTRLDHPASDYRTMVLQWAENRLANIACQDGRAADKAISWPPQPPPPVKEFKTRLLDGNGEISDAVVMRAAGSFLRTKAEREGRNIIRWERPPRIRLPDGSRFLATGGLLP